MNISQSPALKNLQKTLRFIQYLFAQLRQQQCGSHAAALTYTTLFAVVPLMTVTYAILALVPALKSAGTEFQNYIFANFIPETGETILGYLDSFVQQASQLTAVGGVMLFVTSLLLIKKIESTFNQIWSVETPRKGVMAFLLYWAVLSLGPILLGMGLVMSSYLMSLNLLTEAADLIGFKSWGLRFLPMLMSMIALSLIFIAVPNCYVPVRYGLMGGVVCGVLFELAKQGFGFFVSQFPSHRLVYGAFATVPIFLLWLYVSWYVVLTGAALVKALTVYSDHDFEVTDPILDLLTIVRYVANAQEDGRSFYDDEILSALPELNSASWGQYKNTLLRQNIIQELEDGALVGVRDLHRYDLWSLLKDELWRFPDAPDQQEWQRRGFNDALALISGSRDQMKTSLQVSVRELC